MTFPLKGGLALVGMLVAIPSVRADFLYVTDTGNNTVDNISTSGVVTLNSSGYNNPTGIALSLDGSTLYVVNHGNGTVSSVAASGGTPTTFISSGLSSPVGIAVDGTGNVYVVNNGSNSIAQYSSTGALKNASFITNLQSPQYMAFDSTGNIYVTEYGPGPPGTGAGGMVKFPSTGGSGGQLFGQNAWTFPSGVKIGPGADAGFAFFVDKSDGGPNTYNTSTGQLGAPPVRYGGGTPVNAPVGLAFDSNGNLFITNTGNHTITVAPPNGPFSVFPTSGLALSVPTDIAIAQGQAIPEPSTLLLTGLGAGLLGACRCWQHRRGTKCEAAASV